MEIIKNIQNHIYEIRGERVMLDRDLAELYQVENRALKQAVKRNIDRFPKDFMFSLTEKEVNTMVSQNVIPSKSYFGGALPFAFTEQGVAMLSSVLKSKKALQVNIAIIRTFVEVRRLVIQAHTFNVQLQQVRQELLERIGEHDGQLKHIYDAIENLLDKHTDSEEQKRQWKERERIGFKK